MTNQSITGEAKSGIYTAKLEINTSRKQIDVTGLTRIEYDVQVDFYRTGVPESPRISFHYKEFNYDDLFRIPLHVEEAIEKVLREGLPDHRWKEVRHVLRCILGLEKIVAKEFRSD